MKVVFVSPRYDPQAIGGAESAVRSLAEHLATLPNFEVSAYSTCALNHLSWENEVPPGTEDLNGVTVTRFAVAQARTEKFFEVDAALRRSPRTVTLAQSEHWLDLNGPVVPELLDALAHKTADVAVFTPYLFALTARGVLASAMPSVMHPAALGGAVEAEGSGTGEAFCDGREVKGGFIVGRRVHHRRHRRRQDAARRQGEEVWG
ncbi:MAG: hypothetical protein ACRDVP_07870, partial [Acidimicrobiales bacterium]